MDKFASGATRNSADNKPDYEGFLDPETLFAYGEYMHLHRMQTDGKMRDSDNWQKGIPPERLMKSLVRHVIDLWRAHRGNDAVINPDTGELSTEKELSCAVLFNAFAYLRDVLRREHAMEFWASTEQVDSDIIDRDDDTPLTFDE